MSPILFHLPGGIPVRAWGTFLYLGFCVAMWVGSRRMKAGGITGSHMIYIGTIALAGGILGGRLLYLLQYGHSAENGTSGQGMVSFGGWILAISGVVLYLRIRKLPVPAVADMLAPSLAIGEAFGRVGCFLNGCCYGDLCSLPWGVHFPALEGKIAVPFLQFLDGLRLNTQASHEVIATYSYPALHPTQLYSALASLIVFATLLWWSSRKKFDGEIALGFGMLYSVARFLVEVWRNDTPALTAGLSMGQILSLTVFVTCLGVLVYFRHRAER